MYSSLVACIIRRDIELSFLQYRKTVTVVDETTLIWEWHLAPLMCSYNTSYHSTTKYTPFNLIYGMKTDITCIPNRGTATNQLWWRICGRVNTASSINKKNSRTRHQWIKQEVQRKGVHDKSASEHNLEVGEKVLIDNQLFVAKYKKFSPMWIGPFVIIKIINKQNMEVKIKKTDHKSTMCANLKVHESR